jgi:predicted nucleic acid-binding protein
VGDGKLKTAVVDAGPLIHLAEIGCFRLLRIFSPLWVPHAVWLETAKKNRLSQIIVSEEANIVEYSAPQSAVAQFTKEKNLVKLHAGERECLYLCLQKGIGTLLTDDLAVRDAARVLELVPVGSLGIVVAAYKRKQISLSEAEHFIADLCDVSSLFVTREIGELAIEQLHKHPKP